MKKKKDNSSQILWKPKTKTGQKTWREIPIKEFDVERAFAHTSPEFLLSLEGQPFLPSKTFASKDEVVAVVVAVVVVVKHARDDVKKK